MPAVARTAGKAHRFLNADQNNLTAFFIIGYLITIQP